MLVWASEFPLTQGSSAKQFLDVAIKWLTGSPHTPWESTDFAVTPNPGTVESYAKEGQSVQIGVVGEVGSLLVGLQQTWVEKEQRQWHTDIIFQESATEPWVAVRVNCELLRPGRRLPPPKKPYIVRLLIKELGGGEDSGLPVQDRAHQLAEADVADAVRIIDGSGQFKLPIVYVSATRTGTPAVNADELATWLSGTAHVVVEPSRHFSFALARQVSNANPYFGGIGVFWPGSGGAQTRFLPARFDSPHQLQQTIVSRVCEALSEMRPNPDLTWNSLLEAVARGRLDALHSAGSRQVEDYVAAFDAEQKAKSQRLLDSEREIGRLRSEITRLEAATDRATSMLAKGREIDLYPGEIHDAILFALSQNRGHLADGSRRRHIIDDLIAANEPTGTAEDISEDLKRILSGTPSLGSSEKRALRDLGFDLTESGKHIQAVYRGDARYAFVISKTGSDHRGGKNLAAVIARTLFK
jgi:hypothetical protein